MQISRDLLTEFFFEVKALFPGLRLPGDLFLGVQVLLCIIITADVNDVVNDTVYAHV